VGRGQAGRGNLTTRVRLTALAAYCADKLYLPPGYHIQSDADVLMLYRADGSMVAAIVGDAAPSEVSREAEVEYRATGEAAS
jgi:hypothetical protein